MTDLDQDALLAFLHGVFTDHRRAGDAARGLERQLFDAHALLVAAIATEVAGERFVSHNLGQFGAWRSVIGEIREIEATTFRALAADWGEEECCKAEENWYRAVDAQRLIEATGCDFVRWNAA